MKTLKEYIAESKKTYSFKVKVAGDLPESFANDLKARLENRGIMQFEQMKTTPVTEVPHDFPTLKNMEVHTFDVMTEYPITTSEIEKEIFEMGCCEAGYYKVRNSASPTEIDQITMGNKADYEGALLHDNEYKDGMKLKHKDYFGDDFNKGFLKELSKEAKERKKELGHDKLKADVYQDTPKLKQDKAGVKSPVGSN
tara:strand:+ start:2144 stop:2734 length:591 start_codon:yes stop_codon:yes gene_type:complete